MERTPSFDRSLSTGYTITLITPSSVVCDRPTQCVAILNAPMPHVEYFVKCEGTSKGTTKRTFVRAEKINDTALTFITPGNFPPGLVKISIHHGENHNLLARHDNEFTYKSKLDELHDLFQTVSDPMSFMASVYGVETFGNDSVNPVDIKLANNLNACKPPHFDLLKNDKEEDQEVVKECCSRNPTLLHFAARYNLTRLCISLLDCPGSKEALDLKNINGDCPYDLATHCGNNDMARMLSDAKNGNEVQFPTGKIVDDIYEPMSTDVDVDNKRSLIYEAMDQNCDEIYEPMFSSRSNSTSSRKSSDQLSICRSNSENSIDVKFGFASRQQRDASTPPPLPPSVPTQGSSRTGIAKVPRNPLMEELRRVSEEKRGMPSSPPPRPPVSSTKAVHQKQLPTLPGERKGMTPPPLPPYHSATRSKHSSTSSLPEDVYDTLPSRPNSNHIGAVDKQATDDVDDSIYDVPPTPKTPSKNFDAIEDDTYDTLPPPKQLNQFVATPGDVESADEEDTTYDIPPASNLNHHQRIPTPTEPPAEEDGEEEQVYDIPPTLYKPTKVPMMPVTKAKTATPMTSPTAFPENNGDATDGSNDMIYDTPPLPRARENGLYVPAHVVEQFHKPDEDYDILPPSRPLTSASAAASFGSRPLPTGGLTTVPRIPASAAAAPPTEDDVADDTYDVPSRLTTEVEECTYEVPSSSFQSELNDRIGTMRSGLSNSSQDLTSTTAHSNRLLSSKPPRYDLGRTGKRFSEPVINTYVPRSDARTPPLSQRSHMGIPARPPRNANLARSPGTRRKGMKDATPPPLPPQRKPR